MNTLSVLCTNHIIHQINTSSIPTDTNCNSPHFAIAIILFTEISYKFVPEEVSEKVDTLISHQLSNHTFTIGGINNTYNRLLATLTTSPLKSQNE